MLLAPEEKREFVFEYWNLTLFTWLIIYKYLMDIIICLNINLRWSQAWWKWRTSCVCSVIAVRRKWFFDILSDPCESPYFKQIAIAI